MIVKLGERYRDAITGFEGVATARFEDLYGCVRITLEGNDSKGQRVFDERRLEYTRVAVEPVLTGGPRTTPLRTRMS